MPGGFPAWADGTALRFGPKQPAGADQRSDSGRRNRRFASITDPVDLKWDGTHLYVLSGSGAAIYEFATNGTTIRSLGALGQIHPALTWMALAMFMWR